MLSKTRVLFVTRPVCPPWDEASKNFAYALAKNIKGAEIHLLTCGYLADTADNIVQHPIFSSPKLNFAQKLRLFKFLRKSNNFDIVHSLFTPTRINSFFVKQALKGKKVKIIQTVATLREDLYRGDDFKKILFGDQIIIYSDYAREKLEKLGFTNVKRIYPGIDIEKYSPAPKKLEMMEKFEINQNDFVINFTGEFSRLGAIDDVVSSFLDLVKNNPNFKLFLACRIKDKKDKRKKEEIERKINQTGYWNRATFAFDQSYEMKDIYNLCDISVFPVRTMTGKFDIPLAIIEAMACGKPLIASRIEKLRYFLSEENSILINPGSRPELKEKILFLYNNRQARQKIGEKGMKFVRENFDIVKIASQYEELYKEN